MTVPSNERMAAKLREMADLLEAQDADGYRITAYRRAGAVTLTLGVEFMCYHFADAHRLLSPPRLST